MKKNRISNVLKIGVALAATLVLASACGNKEAGGKGNGELPDLGDRYELDPETPAWKLDKNKEPVKLTWYVNADWFNTEYGKDVVTKKIKEDLNVDLKIVTGDNTKLNTYFAGGDMPDIVSIFDANSSVARKANTWAAPLDELAQKYDPYFEKVASKDTLNWFQLSDGKTYGYPNYSNTFEDYEDGTIPGNTNFVIRKDVYDAIGQPKMGTEKEFLAALDKIKVQFPELVPVGFRSFGDSTGSMGDVLQDFIGVPLETKDGKFYDRNLDEDYLTWLRTFNKAYRVGNISDDSFADDGTAFEEKLKSGQYATLMLGGTAQASSFLQTFMNNNPGKEYVAIDGPQSTIGNEPTLGQSGITGWMVNYISKDAKDPAKAIQVFTYLLSEEGQMLNSFGIEGETYTKNADGTVQLMPEVQKMREDNPEQFKKEYRLNEFLFFGHDRTSKLNKDGVPDSMVQLREWGEGKLVPHFILENINPDEGTPEARALTAINTNWNTTLVGLLRSKDDAEFDATLKNYQNFLKDNDWENIEKIRSENMEINKEKLGIN